MPMPNRQPFTNMRFRIEIDGMKGTGAVEVILPEAHIIVVPRKRRRVEYGILTLRRGLTRSSEWYDWWNRSRAPAPTPDRDVFVVLVDERGTDAIRWTYTAAEPVGYVVSSLNALGNEPLIESLELRVGKFDAWFAQTPATRTRR